MKTNTITFAAVMNEPLPHDHITPEISPGKSKKQQVEEMFNRIAGRYDFMNRFLSGGADRGWREKAILLLKKDNPKQILDVATGTGDMAIMACKLLNPEKVTGIDLSTEMLEQGRKKVEKEGLTNKIELLKGDAETIFFPDNSFDAIVVAFGVRNFENLQNGLKEMLRVLKPGGKLIVLEFSRPRRSVFRSLYNLYMGIIAPEIARWFRQNKKAYRYLNESSKAFPDRQLLIDILSNTGFTGAEFKLLSFGICCIYSGKKSPAT